MHVNKVATFLEVSKCLSIQYNVYSLFASLAPRWTCRRKIDLVSMRLYTYSIILPILKCLPRAQESGSGNDYYQRRLWREKKRQRKSGRRNERKVNNSFPLWIEVIGREWEEKKRRKQHQGDMRIMKALERRIGVRNWHKWMQRKEWISVFFFWKW